MPPPAAAAERPRTECLFPQLGQPPPGSPQKARSALGFGPGSGLRRAGSDAVLSRRLADAAGGAYGGDLTPPGGSTLSAATTVLSAATTSFRPPANAPDTCASSGSRSWLSASSPALPSVVASTPPAPFAPTPEERPSPARQRLTRTRSSGPPAGAADVPYEMSCVSSVGSAWLLDYYHEPGHSFTRGLRTLNPRDATETSLGTCVIGPQELPKMPRGQSEEQKVRNIEYLSKCLRELGVETPSPSEVNRRNVTGIRLPENRTRPLKCEHIARSRYQTLVLAQPSA